MDMFERFTDRARKVMALANQDRKSTRLNSSHSQISYAVFCLKKKKINVCERARTPTFSCPLTATEKTSEHRPNPVQPYDLSIVYSTDKDAHQTTLAHTMCAD